jgi:hypothetical protein
MKTQKFATRKPKLETLENRSMMAGNVNAYMSGGDLYVVGDDAANYVRVLGQSNGTVTVVGDFTGGAYTKINGRLGGSANFRITDDVEVYLYGGNDAIEFGNSTGYSPKVADEAYISGGAGNDWIRVHHIQTGRDLRINTGSGKDDTYVGAANIGDDLAIYDPTNIYSGDFDSIGINSSTIRDEIQITTRGGNDNVGITVSKADDLFVSLGAGNDSFSFTQSTQRTHFSIDGGSGYDSFFAPIYGGKRYFGRNFERVTNT